MGVSYDDRFDSVALEPLPEGPTEEKLVDVIELGLARNSYVTMQELEKEFSISNYHVRKYLRRLNIKPFGELKNLKEDGKRKRGIGKHVYRSSVIDDIKELLAATIDTEKFREQARKTLEE